MPREIPGYLNQVVRVLVIDDIQSHSDAVVEALEIAGYKCSCAVSGEEGLALMERSEFDVVVTDLVMRGMSGLEVLKRVKERTKDVQVIVVTGYSTVESAVEAMQEGAANYLTKPVNIKELRAVVARAVETQGLVRSNIELQRQLDLKYGFEGIVGNSPAMQPVFERIAQVAPTNSRVLICGETGTGKELIARAIHNASPRRERPFVPLNCAALSEGVLESELFGHERGAFTGALSARKGRFETANNGTVFLDEVTEMPLSTQVKILRTIEEGEIFRVGSSAPVRVNARILAATNRIPEARVAEGKFREDLYFRLNVVRIDIPPLRERQSDIPLLVNAFVKELAAEHCKNVSSVGIEARRALQGHSWPGNVRELRNCIENMVVVAKGAEIGVDDLPDSISRRPGTQLAADALAGLTLAEIEKCAIAQTLEAVKGNREKAAKMLGIGERTLYRKIKEYGI